MKMEQKFDVLSTSCFDRKLIQFKIKHVTCKHIPIHSSFFSYSLIIQVPLKSWVGSGHGRSKVLNVNKR